MHFGAGTVDILTVVDESSHKINLAEQASDVIPISFTTSNTIEKEIHAVIIRYHMI
jgi:hypothetical protein